MSAATWRSLVLAAAGCAGLVLAGRGQWQGWAIGLAVQPVWVTCLMYGAVYTRNLTVWRRQRDEQSGE